MRSLPFATLPAKTYQHSGNGPAMQNLDSLDSLLDRHYLICPQLLPGLEF